MTTIPKNLHFITGLDQNFGGKPFGFIHYMAIRSAMELNPDFTVYVYYQFEPSGPYWDLVKGDVITVVVQAPSEIFGRPVTHFAHKADILRLQFLLRTGGVYLDLDTICQKPFAPLMHSRPVMGIESATTGMGQWTDGADVGLCNALIMSPPDSPFLKIWFETYRDFDSGHWNNHSVLKPGILARQHADLIHVEPPESFFWPLWTEDGLSMLFAQGHDFPEAYSFHLWESQSWRYVEHLHTDEVITRDTTYNRVARRFIERDMPKLQAIKNDSKNNAMVQARAVFSDIYAHNRWGQGSGSGSAASQNIEYRHFIEKFLITNDIRSVLDFGCGDWQFSRYVDWGNAQYLGIDIVKSVIEGNKSRYGSDTIHFEEFAEFDKIPDVDLVICKDVFQHVSIDVCFAYIENLVHKSRFLLITNDIGPADRINIPITTGDWRPIRLDLPPFNLNTASICSWDVFDGAGPHRKSTYLLYGLSKKS